MNQPFAFRGVSTIEFYSSNLELIFVRRFFAIRYLRKASNRNRSNGLRLNYSRESSAEWEYPIFLILHKLVISPFWRKISTYQTTYLPTTEELKTLWDAAGGATYTAWFFSPLEDVDFFLELGRGYVEYPVDMYII